jgi:hypothetical protein
MSEKPNIGGGYLVKFIGGIGLLYLFRTGIENY